MAVAQRDDDSQESQKGAPVSSLIPNILVVDDDPVVRSQLVRLYTHSGYTVVPVSSAEDALKQLADGNIDFVITDIKLRHGRCRVDYAHAGELS